MSGAEEKKFVIKHIFKDFNGKIDELHGKQETHYNVPWVIDLSIIPYVYFRVCYAQLTCSKPRGADDEWSIETKIEMVVKGSHVEYTNKVFSESVNFVEFEVGCTKGNMEVEFHVTILKMTGIRAEQLRDFDDESARKFSDVVLKVEDRKFHVNKMAGQIGQNIVENVVFFQYLATHSTYFESLLLGNFQESGQTEIELKDIDPEDLQNFLELVYAETLVKDTTVEGILHLADFFDSKTVIRRCEDFLLEKSKKPLKLKFEMAVKYNFDNLKSKCISEMKTADDVISVIPEDSSQFDHTVWKELLLKCYAVKN